MSGSTTDYLTVYEEARIKSLRVETGEHAEANFDLLTKRRLATGVIHEHKSVYRFADGTDVATLDTVLDGILQNMEVIEVQVIPEVAPTGGDKKYTVDIHKGTPAVAYATILTAPLEISVAASSANRTAQYASIDSTKKDFVRGNSTKLVVTASGSTGSQGQGGVVIVKYREHPAA